MPRESTLKYLCRDGIRPTQGLRSKAKLLSYNASGYCLSLICMTPDPIRGKINYPAICEVLNPDGFIHPNNKRAVLRDAMKRYGYSQNPYIGFEQEYPMLQHERPLRPKMAIQLLTSPSTSKNSVHK